MLPDNTLMVPMHEANEQISNSTQNSVILEMKYREDNTAFMALSISLPTNMLSSWKYSGDCVSLDWEFWSPQLGGQQSRRASHSQVWRNEASTILLSNIGLRRWVKIGADLLQKSRNTVPSCQTFLVTEHPYARFVCDLRLEEVEGAGSDRITSVFKCGAGSWGGTLFWAREC